MFSKRPKSTVKLYDLKHSASSWNTEVSDPVVYPVVSSLKVLEYFVTLTKSSIIYEIINLCCAPLTGRYKHNAFPFVGRYEQ